MRGSREVKKTIIQKLIFSIFACFLFVFFSCSNLIDSDYDNQNAEAASQKAYIVFKLIEPNRRSAAEARAVTSGVTSSLFSSITFSGRRADGKTLAPVTAASFTELSAQTIEVEAGQWTFNLEAWLGKTSNAEGEKYTASKNLSVVAGANEVKMSLAPDAASEAAPSFHPGSWEVNIKFPSDSIDRVNVFLFNYSDFAAAGANPSALTKLYSGSFFKETHFSASGQQTLTVGETNRACGNYIVYVSFLKKVGQDEESLESINNWSEFMRINPGVKSTGTITLPNADKSWTITYNPGGASWDSNTPENILVSYTRNSGTNGIITLPTEASFVDRGALYSFDGWYDNSDFSGSAIESFPVTDAANKVFYAKWHEPVYDVYISASGDDANDGSAGHPLKSATAAYAKFDDLIAEDADGNIRNTIHILSDYTGTNKITSPWGDGSKNGMLVKFVGEKGGVENADVTLEVDTHECGTPLGPQTFIYIENNQKMKFSHINFTSSQTYEQPNGYSCLFADDDTELYFEDSSIKGYVANGCAGICVEGSVYLKNCEISGNKAIDEDSDPNKVWGCVVNVGVGQLHVSGSVIIKNNQILKSDGSGALEDEACNVYIGTDENGTKVFHPIVIDDDITGSEIWVKLSEEPATFTTDYGNHESVEPATYFYSDSGLEVRLVSNEARIASVMKVYVSSLSASPAGDDTNGNGNQTSPYKTIARAIQKITQTNNSQTDATIYVTGDVSCNTTIDSDDSVGTKLIANSLLLEGRGTDAALNGNANGSVLDIRTTVPITIKNLTIKNGKSASRGGGLYIDGASLEINNCIIENNSAVIQGGGVYLTNGAQLTMNGASSAIRENAVTGRLNINNTTIENNKCGGGLYIDQGTTKFTMNAGVIEGNGAYSGGGVYVRGTFDMNGDAATTIIQSNKRISGTDDANPNIASMLNVQKTSNVEVGTPGTFNMNGGKITSSLSQGQDGAGVCVYASSHNGDATGTATFNMSGGEISGLTITENAAVFLMGGSGYEMKFNMTGGKITGNTATNAGGSGSSSICAGVYAGTNSRITLGASGSEGEIKICGNTFGYSNAPANIYLKESDLITVAGPLKTITDGYGIGITRGGAFSATPFTSGFATNNGGAAPAGTSPAVVFTSDEGYSIIAGTAGEAAFLTSSASGTVYTPGDYHFTFTASRSSVTVGTAAIVTVTPDITRTEPDGNSTPLYYKAADHKLYLDSALTIPEGSDSEVTWAASLWCGTDVEYPSLTAPIGEDANMFTIPALSFVNTYTLNVTAVYLEYAHNTAFTISCEESD